MQHYMLCNHKSDHHFRADVGADADDRVGVDVRRCPDGAQGRAVVGGGRHPHDAVLVDYLQGKTYNEVEVHCEKCIPSPPPAPRKLTLS